MDRTKERRDNGTGTELRTRQRTGDIRAQDRKGQWTGNKTGYDIERNWTVDKTYRTQDRGQGIKEGRG